MPGCLLQDGWGLALLLHWRLLLVLPQAPLATLLQRRHQDRAHRLHDSSLLTIIKPNPVVEVSCGRVNMQLADKASVMAQP